MFNIIKNKQIMKNIGDLSIRINSIEPKENFIDFSDLEDEFIDYLEKNNIDCYVLELLSDDPPYYDYVIQEKYQKILDNPFLCIEELGFKSISEYMASKQDEQEIVISKTRLVLKGKLNKNYFRK